MATDKHSAKSTPVPAILVALGLVGVSGFIAFTYMTQSSADATLANQSIDLERPAKDLKLQQQGELVAPIAWADKAKGTAAIPVDRAMAITVKTLQDNPAAATPAPPPPKDPMVDADGGTDAAETDSDGGAEAAATDAGAQATDAGAEARAPVAPKPVAPKPVAPNPTPPPEPPTTP